MTVGMSSMLKSTRHGHWRVLSSAIQPTRKRKIGFCHSCSTTTTTATPAFPNGTCILFLSGLFPEPTASAAGVRTQFLVEQLARTQGVESIRFGTGSPQPKTDAQGVTALKEIGVDFHHVPPNDSETIQDLLEPHGAGEQLVVILDRFYAEEAYSFHIHQHCPEAAIVLDMQDLHALRRHRQESIPFNNSSTTHHNQTDPVANLPMEFPNAHDKTLQRELASIHRSDLSLVCSPVELQQLQTRYHIPRHKLSLTTFFLKPETDTNLPAFHQRTDFVFVGGFRHDPNADAIRQMKSLWPNIRQQLPDANFHVFGPFCPNHLQQECHDPSNGFHIHGYSSRSVRDLLSNRRVLLAPLRFGAGIKGKIVDAWTSGTPVVTTPIGAEGMVGKTTRSWGGAIANNSHEFVKAAVNLYRDEQLWKKAQAKGTKLVEELYDINHWDSVLRQLVDLRCDLESRREMDFTRSVVWQQSNRSTEYFSRWIELKEASRKNSK